MTTIAYRDGIMASDSMVSDRGAAVGSIRKIQSRQDGAVAGVCGLLSDFSAFFDWFQSNGVFPAPEATDNEFEAVMADAHGDVWYIGKNGRGVRFSAPFYACGAGFKVALGAMHAGADAERAIEIACLVDSQTAPPVIVERVRSA